MLSEQPTLKVAPQRHHLQRINALFSSNLGYFWRHLLIDALPEELFVNHRRLDIHVLNFFPDNSVKFSRRFVIIV